MPRLWSSRSTSNQLASGVTILQEAKLSSAVPQSTAFLPPAFIATLPPIQQASAEVGSQANSKPASVAASIARRVTTPAPQRTVGTCLPTPGKVRISTRLNVSNFSVLMTAESLVNGIAPPVYPVPPPRGIMVSPSSIQALTNAATSSSVSGLITTNGYSTRQSVASVTCDTRAKPSN